MEVQKMDAEKYQKYVTKEFDKIVSCKLGKLETEKNKRIGPKPVYTHDEKEAIIKGRAHVIRLSVVQGFKEIMDQLDMVDCMDNYLSSELENYQSMDDLFTEARAGFFDHPDYPAWEERAQKIREEFNVREVNLEKTVANVVRDFCTGILQPGNLNRELDKIETEEF